MAPGPALGFGGPCSAPLLAIPFPVGWEAKETGQGPGSPLIECSEYLGVLESPLGCKEIQESILRKSVLNFHWKE